MFASSAGFSFDLHFCQGHLKSVSLIGKAKSCHTVVKKKACHHNPVASTKKSCCDNQTVLVDLDTDYVKNKSVELSKNNVVSWLAVLSDYSITVFEDRFQHNDHYKNYKPPLLYKDIPVFVQSFLI